MKSNTLYLLILLSSALFSCTSTNMIKYYGQHKSLLDSIQQSYKQEYKQRRFSVEFLDKKFNNVSIEIFTDTLKYIYAFGLAEPRLKDTLAKYQFRVPQVEKLIADMRSIKCIWINNLDYYLDRKKNTLVFISIKRKHLRFPFTRKKYFILTYFPQPQYYDADGRLLDRRKRKRLRKINEDVFTRITDKVAYTISDRFR
jgi:hypothetical protein